MNASTKLTDDEVEALRTLYEEDQVLPRGQRFWTAPRLAEKFEISLRYVRMLVAYERR